MEIVEGLNQLKIAPKGTKLIEVVEKGEQDRISALPDCLVIEILSRLPSTKEAIRTGALSKRWKHLWTWVTNLIFTTECRENPISMSDFVSFVEKTLTQCRQLKLNKFEVLIRYPCPGFDIQLDTQFHNWIRYAVSCNVEELNLKFWCRKEPEFLLDQFLFTSSCFTDLTLVGCILDPIGAISWKNLRKLSLSYVKTEEDLIVNILSGSPQLETLVLECCYGYRLLNITSKSVKKLVFCGFDDLEHQMYREDIIEINAPNISSLTIEGELFLWKVVLLNVSSLVEAELDYVKQGLYEKSLKEAREDMLKGYILNLRHVKELKIGPFCSSALYRLKAKGFVFPSNLKFPDITSDITTDSSDSDGDSDSDSESESESESESDSESDTDAVESGDW